MATFYVSRYCCSDLLLRLAVLILLLLAIIILLGRTRDFL